MLALFPANSVLKKDTVIYLKYLDVTTFNYQLPKTWVYQYFLIDVASKVNLDARLFVIWFVRCQLTFQERKLQNIPASKFMFEVIL